MTLKELEKHFEKQPFKTVKVGKKTEKRGKIWFGTRYHESDGKMIEYIVSAIDRAEIKSLKGLIFEKYTGAGWPIFQTKAYAKHAAS